MLSMPAVRRSPDAALAFVRRAVDDTADRLPAVDREAMQLVLLLHRVTNAIVYDLESTVHRPSGWSWSAFRAVFTLWVSGPMEPSRLAEQSGMSRQAVSAPLKTLAAEAIGFDIGRPLLVVNCAPPGYTLLHSAQPRLYPSASRAAALQGRARLAGWPSPWRTTASRKHWCAASHVVAGCALRYLR